MREDYYREALGIVDDPYVLVSMMWGRMQMLRRGHRPLVESIEGLEPADVALREIIEGRITYVLGNMVVLEEIVGLENVVTRRRPGGVREDPSIMPLVGSPCNAVAPM